MKWQIRKRFLTTTALPIVALGFGLLFIARPKTVVRCRLRTEDVVRAVLSDIANSCECALVQMRNEPQADCSPSNVVMRALVLLTGCEDANALATTQHDNLVDWWGNPYQISFRGFTYPSNISPSTSPADDAFIIWSVGENGINEGGAGDDICLITPAIQ